MSIRRAHDLFSRIHAVATAEAVEAAATAANAQLKLEQARHRSVASSHPNSHPRGGYAKAMANRWDIEVVLSTSETTAPTMKTTMAMTASMMLTPFPET